MPGQYSVEDLLKLRASPLICKPPNLPAIDEFLSTQESSTKKPTTRGRPEDATNQSEGFPKRPLLDASQRKSTTDPDRIVLGPPKRSFASSSARANGKTADGDEGTRDGQKSLGERRANGRFAREEGDEKYGRRPRDDDGEARPRRDYERKPKWAAEEGEEQKPRSGKRFDQPWFRSDRPGDSLEDTTRDGDREWRRGGGRERGHDKHMPAEAEPEWMDAPIEEEAAAPPRTQEDFQRWRERMKAGKPAETSDQPIFSPLSPPPSAIEPKPPLPQFFDEPDDSMDKFYTRLSEQKAAAEKPQTVTKPAGKSKFAALFGPPPPEMQKAVSPEPTFQQQPQAPLREQSSSADPIQQMFGTMSMREKPAPLSMSGAGPGSPLPPGDDQAGFARILEMLQGRSNNPTPQGQEAKPSRTSLHGKDSQVVSESSQAGPQGMPLLQLLNGGNPAGARGPGPEKPTSTGQDSGPSRASLQERGPQHLVESPQGGPTGAPLLQLLSGGYPGTKGPEPDRHVTAPERFESSRTPVEHGHGRHSSQKDEVLLNLLKQANQVPKPTPGAEQYGPRGMSGENLNRAALARNQMASPPGIPDPAMLQRRDNGRPDESTHMRYGDEISPQEYMARRSAGEPPMYGDEQLFNSLRGASGGKQGQPPSHGPPPGLGRPPGLEQMPRRMPPPGWAGHLPPPQQQQQQQQLQYRQQGPPGIPGGRPNMPPGYGMPPPSQQGQGQRPPQGSAPPPQRKYTGESGMPMMGPPPGFMGNGPPPGLLGLLNQQPPPPQQRYHMQGGPPEPQGLGRAFMDMYGDGLGPTGPPSGRNGVRGTGGHIGGYR